MPVLSSVYNQVLFRPRVLRDVTTVDTSTAFLGYDVSLPIFICPCGMAKLSHPEGEKLFASAAGKTGIAQFVSRSREPATAAQHTLPLTQRLTLLPLCDQISTNASAPLADILSGAQNPEQPFFMQLYVDRQRHKTEALMKKIEQTGQIKGYFVTVDAAAPGKREADERSRAEVEVVRPQHPSPLHAARPAWADMLALLRLRLRASLAVRSRATRRAAASAARLVVSSIRGASKAGR
jgi:L-lactate dehydrogenase (cytochrome)